MAEKRTVHLTYQTLSMIRPGESLSGRINDIFERYAVLREHLPNVQITWVDSSHECQEALRLFMEALTED